MRLLQLLPPPVQPLPRLLLLPLLLGRASVVAVLPVLHRPLTLMPLLWVMPALLQPPACMCAACLLGRWLLSFRE